MKLRWYLIFKSKFKYANWKLKTHLSSQLINFSSSHITYKAANTMAGQVMGDDNKTGNQTANQTVGGGLKSKVGG